MSETPFGDACRVVLKYGYTPVRTDGMNRLRAWLDLNNYWPPKDWQPESGDEVTDRD